MKPVFQRIICNKRGDCQTCVIASLLELDYEQVPRWVADAHDAGKIHEWLPAMAAWLRARGWHYLSYEWRELRDWRHLEGALCVASMPSQKFPGSGHAVVGQWVPCPERILRFAVAHDPNPGNDPYPPEVVPQRVSFLVPIDPVCRK